MKTVALISGGKDSCFNMMSCVAEGHEIVALANLRPEAEGQHELDSYMFQTVGHTAIDLYAEAMGLPLYVQSISGGSLATGGVYTPQEGDEVEDLYRLLQAVKDDVTIEAVSVGAILSDYQRVRVENVCGRLGLTVLSFLWRRDQQQLLQEMIACGIKAKIIKVAALGLEPDRHLGMELTEIYPHMLKMKSKYGLNVCGEGGEYETFVFDCPLFRQRINIEKTEQVIHSDDAFAPVGYLILKSCSLEPKSNWDPTTPLRSQMKSLPMLTSDKWLASLELDKDVVPDPAGTDLDTPVGALGGAGGDSQLPSTVMCVPDAPIDGSESPKFCSDGTRFQVSGVRAIISREVDLQQATQCAMNSLKDCLSSHSRSMEDIVSVSLSVGCMNNFATVNSVYKQFFDLNPPVRVCVEASLPRNVALQLDCQGYCQSNPSEEGRRSLHVQALSHWAPANIGPYSQAVLVDGKLHVAGIIAMVPATLELVGGGFGSQCALALHHVQTVMSVAAPGCQLSSCPMVTCYVTRSEVMEEARHCWNTAVLKASKASTDITEPLEPASSPQPSLQFMLVSALPKAALVEWHVTAWPGLDLQVKEFREVRHFESHSIHASAQMCEGRPHLFSCHMTLEVLNYQSVQRTDRVTLPAQMVELFSVLWRQSRLAAAKSAEACNDAEEANTPADAQQTRSLCAMPLVKIFFSPALFDYTQLHTCFSDALRSSSLAQESSPLPVFSLVPVSGLGSGKQVLAWCQ